MMPIACLGSAAREVFRQPTFSAQSVISRRTRSWMTAVEAEAAPQNLGGYVGLMAGTDGPLVTFDVLHPRTPISDHDGFLSLVVRCQRHCHPLRHALSTCIPYRRDSIYQHYFLLDRFRFAVDKLRLASPTHRPPI